jgi:hypothetical protein
MIQEQKLQQDLQQQQQNAVIGGNPYDAYRAAQPVVPPVSPVYLSWEPTNKKIWWNDGTFSGETYISVFQSTVNWNTLNNIELNDPPYTSLIIGNQVPLLADVRLSSAQLGTIDVSSLPNLYQLYADYNSLTSLDVTNNTELLYLYCHHNSLTSIDLSNNIILEELYIHNNQLTSLDISNNIALTTLAIDNNQLTSLDISNNPLIYYIQINDNLLTTINITNNTLLTNINFSFNQLNQSTVNHILTTLDSHGLSNGSCYLAGGTNAAPSGTGLTAKTNLQGKGWTITNN